MLPNLLRRQQPAATAVATVAAMAEVMAVATAAATAEVTVAATAVATAARQRQQGYRRVALQLLNSSLRRPVSTPSTVRSTGTGAWKES